MTLKRASRLILKPQIAGDQSIHGVIFDLDGTMCLPQTWMFKAMREALGIVDKPVDILDHLETLSLEEQSVANYKLEMVEQRAMNEMQPQPGLVELMEYLTSNDLRKGVCTRNLIKPVHHLMENFVPTHELKPIVTRTFNPPKPSPKPLLYICETWGVGATNVIMVGDSIDDMKAGHSAGCGTILLGNDVNTHLWDLEEVDHVAQSLHEIIDLIENGINIKEKPY